MGQVIANAIDYTIERTALRGLATIVLCCGIGFISCQYYFTYPLSAVIVVLWLTAGSRRLASAYVASYSIFSSWVVVPAIVDYLDWAPAKAVGLWLIGLCIVLLPWSLLYRKDGKYAIFRTALVMACTFVPPLGVVQFASPFVGTSMLIPGLGVVSMIVGLGLIVLISEGHRSGMYNTAVTTALVFGLATLTGLFSTPKSPDGWVAVNTGVEVGGLEHTIVGSMEALTIAKKVAYDKRPDVVVLGESTGGYSVEAGLAVLGRSTEETIVIAGGRDINKQTVIKWEEGVGEIGYRQRLRPVLLGHMDSAHDGNKTMIIDGLVVAPLICYEGAVPFPMITVMPTKPDVVMGIGNFYWSRNSEYFERVFRAHVTAWARIFGTDRIVAVNGGKNV